MADPLSVSASLITLLGTSFAVSKGLFQLAAGIGAAGREVRLYADEIDTFSKLLARIRDEVLQQPRLVTLRAQALLEDIVSICQRVLDPMNCIQATLNPLLSRFKETKSKLRHFSLRVRWIFSTKDKLLFYRGMLKSQHRLLDTSLTAMTLSAVGQGSQMVWIQQLSIENSISGIKGILQDTGMRVTNRDPSQGPYLLLESAPPEDEDPLYTDSRAYDTSSLHRVLLGNRIPSASIVFQSHDQGIGKTQDDRGVEDVDEAVNSGMEENVDSSHEDLVQELWEDMRVVSRKVLRYASDSLDQSHTAAEDSTPLSEPTDAKSPDHATMNLNSAFTASSSRQGLDEEKPCESSTEDPAADPFKPPGEVRDPEANASQTKGSSSQSEGLEELQSDFASTSGLQMGPDKAGVPGATHDLIDLESPAMYMVSPRLSPRSFPINGPEIQMGGPLPPLPPPGTAAGVIITRPNNKPYEIPFRIARDSNNVTELLCSLYQPRSGPDNRPMAFKRQDEYEIKMIREGNYDLIGPEGQVLLPQFWTELVTPGRTVWLDFN